jgi:hypothetical protein
MRWAMNLVRRAGDEIRSLAKFWGDEANRRALYEHHLGQAKVLSDFIGMIMRFGFAIFATGYFFKRASELQGFDRWCLNVTTFTCLGLTIAFGYRLGVVILLHEMRSVPAARRTWSRMLFALLAIMTASSLSYGMMDLAKALSAQVNR